MNGLIAAFLLGMYVVMFVLGVCFGIDYQLRQMHRVEQVIIEGSLQ